MQLARPGLVNTRNVGNNQKCVIRHMLKISKNTFLSERRPQCGMQRARQGLVKLNLDKIQTKFKDDLSNSKQMFNNIKNLEIRGARGLRKLYFFPRNPSRISQGTLRKLSGCSRETLRSLLRSIWADPALDEIPSGFEHKSRSSSQLECKRSFSCRFHCTLLQVGATM